ncbi:MAG: type I pullulanase [Paludibacteraceae bacterium]|nr:type I pullulanase [Paludibacteraceae bacterium]
MHYSLCISQTFHFDEMTYSPGETVFRLFAPADATCFVVLGEDSLPMSLGTDSIWTVTAKGDHKGKTYQFVVNGQASPGVFAKAVTVNGGKGVVMDLRETDPEGWDADKRPELKSPADLVIYELHHRDFSIARPGARYPGKFLALTEPWAIEHLKQLGINAVHILPSFDFASIDETAAAPASSASPVVSSLSVPCAAALPQPQYNWGYDPLNYNVPEGSYATDPYSPSCRIREFKQMVQALHAAGIRVILDVVYNHTFDIARSNFQLTYPDYYYRKTSDNTYSDGSGCGNETASEQPMMRRFMIESVRYWVNEYHIDGFRFDLMGVHDIATMNAIRQALDAIDPSIFVYGEGWSAGPCALPNDQLAMKANIPQLPRIAAFSDELRDALRGPFSDDTKPGWLGLAGDDEKTTTKTTKTTSADEEKLSQLSSKNNDQLLSLKESLKFGIAGGIAHPQVDMSKVNYSKEPWATEPTQFLSYVSCHDDMCLVDRLCASVPSCSLCSGAASAPSVAASSASSSSVASCSLCSGAAAAPVSPPSPSLLRLSLLAQTAVFTSQGVPFLLCGEELLRTKQGVHNSYKSPDSINHLDWSNKERFPEVFSYYQGLIALRRQFPAFRLGSAALVRQHLEFLPSPPTVVAFRLKDYGDSNIIVILNGGAATTVAIPEGTYTIVCKDGVIDTQGLGTATGSSVTVSPQSALILHD